MTGKSSTHSTRTPHDWEQLIERYYAGETSLHEEEELRKFLFSGEADDRLFVVVVLPRKEGGDGQTFLSLCDRCADEQQASDEYFV